jgi:hypothetical protein
VYPSSRQAPSACFIGDEALSRHATLALVSPAIHLPGLHGPLKLREARTRYRGRVAAVRPCGRGRVGGAVREGPRERPCGRGRVGGAEGGALDRGVDLRRAT